METSHPLLEEIYLYISNIQKTALPDELLGMIVSSAFLSPSTSLSMPEKVEQPLQGECESLSHRRQTTEPQNNEVIGFCLTGNVCTHGQLLHPGTGEHGPWSEPASAGLDLG